MKIIEEEDKIIIIVKFIKIEDNIKMKGIIIVIEMIEVDQIGT